MSLTNNDKIYGYLTEKRSFHTFDLYVIIARFCIYTAAKESGLYSFLAFKSLLEYELSVEPSSVLESFSLKPHTSLICSVDFCYWIFFSNLD